VDTFEARWRYFPYCIKRLPDGRYILLNRLYKPLGVVSREWVVYEEHPSAAAMNITPAMARKLSWEESENVDFIFLYNDGCIPTRGAEHMKAYLDRVAVLMKITVEGA